MNIEKFRMEKKIILLSAVLIALLLKLEKLYKKMWEKKQIFLVSILFKKLREEKGWGGGGGYPSVAAYSRKIFQVLVV